jgi:hypothetical protein
VLYDLAQEASPKKPVRTVSFDVSQIFMGKEQARARKRILAWMKKKGLHVDHNEIKVELGGGVFHHGNPQAVLWLLATQSLKKKEDLYTGYVLKDDWWLDYGSWSSIFRTLQTLADRSGILQMPLCRTYKRDVLKRLDKLGLLSLTWWCAATDLPKNKLRKAPCGNCSSCIDHETALWQRERFGKVELKEK